MRPFTRRNYIPALHLLGEALDDFTKSFFPRGHQGKRRPIRPAFLAKGRSDATEFENLNELDARKAGNEPNDLPGSRCLKPLIGTRKDNMGQGHRSDVSNPRSM